MKKIIVTVTLAVLLVLCAAGALAATTGQGGQGGLVLTVQAGAWVERDGQKTALNVKSEVLPGDVLVTDASGRVQVIFSDDTTISLGADTRVAVAEFLFDVPGQKPSFSADMAQGAARFVTGKVVEQNREGFSVTTPQATVGIRGTTFAVNVSPRGVTSVIGLKVDGAFPIAVTNLNTGAVSTITAPGMAVDAAPGGNTSYQAPPGQFSQTGSAVSGQPKVAAASASAGESTAEVGAAAVAGSTPSAGLVSSTAATGVSLVAAAQAEAAGDAGATRSLANSVNKGTSDILADLGRPDFSNASGTYSGVLYNGIIGSGIVGDFGFNASLSAGNGQITGAWLNDSNYGAIASQRNGPAQVSNGNFTVDMGVDSKYTGTSGNSHWVPVGNPGSMTGSFAGDDVSGKWDVGIYGGDTYFKGEKQ